MTPVEMTGSLTLRNGPIARLLLVVGLILGLTPGLPAIAGTRIRPTPRKAPAPRKVTRSKRPAATPPPPPPNRPATTSIKSVPAPSVPPSVADQVVDLTNEARQANGLTTLAVDSRLTEAAQIQAEAMASLGEMEHELPGTPLPTFPDRLEYVDYDHGWAAENIGCLAPDAATVEQLWLASPFHRKNILLPNFTATGVGVAYGNGGTPYYCQVFASPK